MPEVKRTRAGSSSSNGWLAVKALIGLIGNSLMPLLAGDTFSPIYFICYLERWGNRIAAAAP